MNEAAIPAAKTGAPPRSASKRPWLEAAAITALLAGMALATYNAVTTDRFAADLAITEQHLDQPRGKSGLNRRLSVEAGGQAGQFRRLDYDGATRGQSGSGFRA